MRRLSVLGLTQHQQLFDDTFVTGVGRDVFREADVIVGLHPDEATEVIVDLAIKYDKPFAVVPCCVFPTMFPGRVGRDGEEVRSHAQFCDYLEDKHEGVMRVELEELMKPANVVLYYKPKG